MKKINNIHSSAIPPEIKVTSDSVYVASNIHSYTQTIQDYEISGYEYDCTIYTKDQYILIIAQQTKAIEELEDQLEAAKILLGVD